MEASHSVTEEFSIQEQEYLSLLREGEVESFFIGSRDIILSDYKKDIREKRKNSQYSCSVFYPEVFDLRWSLKLNKEFMVIGKQRRKIFILTTDVNTLSTHRLAIVNKTYAREIYFLKKNGYTFRTQGENQVAIPPLEHTLEKRPLPGEEIFREGINYDEGSKFCSALGKIKDVQDSKELKSMIEQIKQEILEWQNQSEEKIKKAIKI